MLDEDVVTDAAAPADERRTKTSTFVLSITGTAVLLSVAYFPFYFNTLVSYDDEGSFLTVVHQFLHHGDLYGNTHGPYGPFYFSAIGLIFRLTGQDPTLFTGRLIVLVFTAVSAAMFAATVWRVTHNLMFSLLAELVTYFMLVRVAGNEPLHPGSMIVLLLSVLTFALASYTMEQATAPLLVVGAVLGALTMIKVNIGIFAAVAVVVAFVLGNTQYSKRVRAVVAVAALLVPFGVTFQLLYKVEIFQLAVLVSLGLLVVYAPLSVDAIAFPRQVLGVMAAPAVVVMAVSSVWPLATGTSPRELFHGVVIQPLGQAANLAVIQPVQFEWLIMLLAACAAAAVLARRDRAVATERQRSWMFDAALGVAGVAGLVVGLVYGFGAWVPVVALLPALAWLADQTPTTRLALRFLVPLAILQLLHAYPVVGSQNRWGSVVMCVPCVIAIVAAAQRLTTWQQAGPTLRVAAVGGFVVVLAAAAGFWPVTAWHDYEKAEPLGLRGARYVRVDPALAKDLQRLTAVVRQGCDTFYSAPALDSLYVFTGLPLPTGFLANAPGALDLDEQRKLARELADARASGKRVCIVRNTVALPYWYLSAYGRGPLAGVLAQYQRQVARVHQYTVSHFGPPRRSAAR